MPRRFSAPRSAARSAVPRTARAAAAAARHLALAALVLGLATDLAAASGADPLDGVPGSASLVATGFVFTEGPVWDDARGGLVFSDFGDPFSACLGKIRLYRDGLGVSLLFNPSCNANGLALDGAGDLIAAEHGSRSVTRRPAGGGPKVSLASSYLGVPFNAPNDVAVRSDGTIYFTDPDFVKPAPPVLGFNGLYRIRSRTGSVKLEAVIDSPNGVALSPDERTLYVTNQDLDQVLAFDVLKGGRLVNQRVFARGTPSADGMTVDRDGNLFVATSSGGAGAVLVFAPDGSYWGAIAVAEPTRNCAFGRTDRKTLFITAGVSIYAVELPIPGVTDAPPPRPRWPAWVRGLPEPFGALFQF